MNRDGTVLFRTGVGLRGCSSKQDYQLTSEKYSASSFNVMNLNM